MNKEPRRVSFSQFQTWSNCPRQYKLKYVDKNTTYGSIATIFGTGVHETLQQYLTVMFSETKKKANELDLPALLMKHMKAALLEEKAKLKKNGITDLTTVCTKGELKEHYEDGLLFLEWFKKPKNQAKFYWKKGMKLRGIELPLEVKIRDGIVFIAYLDIVFENMVTKKIKIIDIKTSTKGWGHWQKGSDLKMSQIRLYKKFYSEQYDVDLSKINIAFHIMRRKVPQHSEFPIPRMSSYVPAHGSVSMNKATRAFDEFVDTVFNDDGTFKITEESDFVKIPSKLCEWCTFYQKKDGNGDIMCDGKED